MKAALIVSSLASLLVAAPSAQADEAQISRDIRCFSLLGPAAIRMSRGSSPRVRAEGSKAMQAASFYLGRVDATVAPAELGERIRRERATLTDADPRAETARCLRDMQATERRLDSVAAQLKSSLPAR